MSLRAFLCFAYLLVLAGQPLQNFKEGTKATLIRISAQIFIQVPQTCLTIVILALVFSTLQMQIGLKQILGFQALGEQRVESYNKNLVKGFNYLKIWFLIALAVDLFFWATPVTFQPLWLLISEAWSFNSFVLMKLLTIVTLSATFCSTRKLLKRQPVCNTISCRSSRAFKCDQCKLITQALDKFRIRFEIIFITMLVLFVIGCTAQELLVYRIIWYLYQNIELKLFLSYQLPFTIIGYSYEAIINFLVLFLRLSLVKRKVRQEAAEQKKIEQNKTIEIKESFIEEADLRPQSHINSLEKQKEKPFMQIIQYDSDEDRLDTLSQRTISDESIKQENNNSED